MKGDDKSEFLGDNGETCGRKTKFATLARFQPMYRQLKDTVGNRGCCGAPGRSVWLMLPRPTIAMLLNDQAQKSSDGR
ncbi:hypothetical protein SAMN06265222_10875 [Neorhodopirellula lusitana]|uniref:Uncharacterized protein n=1 Tax=Neorhodopirellula lusitana TaxID=445327 RepID=A0ABY1Q9Z1_9BACT|nr:hypothetical protein SAMN06265222_10875 [Neorhodopirellula lusitana]